MSSRKQSKVAAPRSKRAILGIWLAAVLSLGLLFLAGQALLSDLGSFRACNTPGALSISNCGKQGLNVGDFVIFVWLVLSAALALSLCTAALRTIPRRRK
jgi:hypothetical protein